MSDPASTAPPVPRLETARLVLREITPADAPALHAVFGDAQVTEHYDLETFTSQAQALALIEQFASVQRAGKGVRWAIERKHEPGLIGTCGFNEWARVSRRGGLGYDLARAHWGQGLVGEAVGAVLAHGFGAMALHRIEAFVMRGNQRSVRLLRRHGFSEEGVLRERGAWKGQFHDLRLFSLLAHEYAPHSQTQG